MRNIASFCIHWWAQRNYRLCLVTDLPSPSLPPCPIHSTTCQLTHHSVTLCHSISLLPHRISSSVHWCYYHQLRRHLNYFIKLTNNRSHCCHCNYPFNPQSTSPLICSPKRLLVVSLANERHYIALYLFLPINHSLHILSFSIRHLPKIFSGCFHLIDISWFVFSRTSITREYF